MLKKKRVISIFIVFLILLTTSCKIENECKENCKGDARCIILCENPDIVRQAVAENDFNLCEQLTQKARDACKDQIYLKMAVTQDNIELCNNILDKNFINSCFDFYYYGKAKTTKDLSYCNKIINIEKKSLCEAIK